MTTDSSLSEKAQLAIQEVNRATWVEESTRTRTKAAIRKADLQPGVLTVGDVMTSFSILSARYRPAEADLPEPAVLQIAPAT